MEGGIEERPRARDWVLSAGLTLPPRRDIRVVTLKPSSLTLSLALSGLNYGR